MRNKFFLGLLFSVVGFGLCCFLQFFSDFNIPSRKYRHLIDVAGSQREELKECNRRLREAKTEVIKQLDTITAYRKALIGEERDVLDMYDSIQETDQIEIVVHNETESGLPSKFILSCEGMKK